MSSATLKSIARATGFSVTTVSRALGGFDDVNEETRQLIAAEAEHQGYAPNLHARALQTRRTQTVGLIVPISGPRFPDPFFSEFVAGAGSAVADSGFDLLLSTHSSLNNELDIYRRMVVGRRVDGLIVIRTRYQDTRIQFLARSNIPFVAFGRTSSEHDYVYIDVDGTLGQFLLTEHFIALGHRRIACVMAPYDLMFSHYRLQGFRDAMARHNITVDSSLLIEGELNERGGREAAHHLLALKDPPTAIMTGNDLMAFGVMNVIQERGLRVGHDIAVGGFDDIPSSEHMHPGLTTVHQPIYDIGHLTARTLLQIIRGQPVVNAATLITPELIVRASSGPVRPSGQ